MPTLGFELWDCQAWRDAGLALSTTSNEAAKMYDASVSQLFGWLNDETLGGMEGTLKAMTEADPNFVLGQVTGCYLNLMGGGRSLNQAEASLKDAQRVIDLAAKSELNDREKLYVQALKFLAKGNDLEANGVLAEILVSYPTDRFALKAVAEGYFIAGERERQRDVIGRCMPRWSKDMRQYGYLYGMYGFGLEETGNYAAAEKMGKLGCEWNRFDPWSRHCLSHVYEMTGRPDESIRHLSSSEKDWTHYGNLVCHNYWHWGLSHIEKGEYEEALGIYDSQMLPRFVENRPGVPTVMFFDAASTLERLQFEGVDVGARWSDLLEKSRPYLDDPDHYWTFADGHLMFMACHAPGSGGAKLLQSAKKFVEEQTGDNRDTMARVGVPLMEAIYEYEQGNHEAAVSALYPVRYDISRLGGSDAQREVFHLLLISAATKSPNKQHQKLAKSLIAERRCIKEESPLNERLAARVVALHGE